MDRSPISTTAMELLVAVPSPIIVDQGTKVSIAGPEVVVDDEAANVDTRTDPIDDEIADLVVEPHKVLDAPIT